jgi:hypothetical protein
LLFQIEQRADQGLPPKSEKFSKIIDDYIRYRERDHQHGKTSAGMLRQIVRVSKFWREYAGELAVDVIDDKVMLEFIPWRRDFRCSNFTSCEQRSDHCSDASSSRSHSAFGVRPNSDRGSASVFDECIPRTFFVINPSEEGQSITLERFGVVEQLDRLQIT